VGRRGPRFLSLSSRVRVLQKFKNRWSNPSCLAHTSYQTPIIIARSSWFVPIATTCFLLLFFCYSDRTAFVKISVCSNDLHTLGTGVLFVIENDWKNIFEISNTCGFWLPFFPDPLNIIIFIQVGCPIDIRIQCAPTRDDSYCVCSTIFR